MGKRYKDIQNFRAGFSANDEKATISIDSLRITQIHLSKDSGDEKRNGQYGEELTTLQKLFNLEGKLLNTAFVENGEKDKTWFVYEDDKEKVVHLVTPQNEGISSIEFYADAKYYFIDKNKNEWGEADFESFERGAFIKLGPLSPSPRPSHL